MKDLNKELSNLSKNLASVTVSSILKKHNVSNKTEFNNLSSDQKKELVEMANNLENLVNDYVNNEEMEGSQEQIQEVLSDESPLRKLLRKTKNKESDK